MITIIFCCAISFAQHDMNHMESIKKQPSQAATYTCPMHPEIHASKPGNCPKCGMKLVKEKPKTTAPKKNDSEKKGNKCTRSERYCKTPA